MNDQHIVRARDLGVKLSGSAILHGLNLAVPSGKITALLGANGAGKTTLIRAIATLQPVSAGALTVAGYDVQKQSHKVRGVLGLAGQHTALVNELTGIENLRLVARLAGVSRRGLQSAVNRVVGDFGLRDFVRGRVATYSGGQRRRLDLAATLVSRPALLLLDEPTTGLDPMSRRELWRYVQALPGSDTSVVLTTQNLEEAQALADWVAVIDRGRIIKTGTPDELRRELNIATLAVMTRRELSRDAVLSVGSSLGATVIHHEGARFSLAGRFQLQSAVDAIGAQGIASHEITEFALAPPSLEEALLATNPKESI